MSKVANTIPAVSPMRSAVTVIVLPLASLALAKFAAVKRIAGGSMMVIVSGFVPINAPPTGAPRFAVNVSFPSTVASLMIEIVRCTV